MGELTCDDCGTINHDSRSTCELCGESLAEEEQRREEQKHQWLAPFAWTGIGMFLFAIFFGGQVWWQARRMARYDSTVVGNRVTSEHLFEVLMEPTSALLVAGIMTAVVIGGGIYKMELE